jgi:hypothetical protein
MVLTAGLAIAMLAGCAYDNGYYGYGSYGYGYGNRYDNGYYRDRYRGNYRGGYRMGGRYYDCRNSYDRRYCR